MSLELIHAFSCDIYKFQIPENDETFQIELVSGNGGVKINETSSTATLVVRGNDSPIRLNRLGLSLLVWEYGFHALI